MTRAAQTPHTAPADVDGLLDLAQHEAEAAYHLGPIRSAGESAPTLIPGLTDHLPLTRRPA